MWGSWRQAENDADLLMFYTGRIWEPKLSWERLEFWDANTMSLLSKALCSPNILTWLLVAAVEALLLGDFLFFVVSLPSLRRKLWLRSFVLHVWRPCYITCKCSGKAWGFLILNYKIGSTNTMALDSQVLIRYFWCWRLLCAAVGAEGWFGPGCHSTRPVPPITCMMYWSGGQCYWRVLSSEREDENKPVSSPCIVHWVFVLSSKGLMFDNE